MGGEEGDCLLQLESEDTWTDSEAHESCLASVDQMIQDDILDRIHVIRHEEKAVSQGPTVTIPKGDTDSDSCSPRSIRSGSGSSTRGRKRSSSIERQCGSPEQNYEGNRDSSRELVAADRESEQSDCDHVGLIMPIDTEET